MAQSTAGGVGGLDKLYLGLDCSTQALKLLLIDDHDNIRFQVSVNYDASLPWYGTQGGCIKGDPTLCANSSRELVVTAPSLMFVEALEMALDQLKASVPNEIDKIQAISGSGQQHGSVWLRKDVEDVFLSINPSLSLTQQFKDANIFSIPNGPIWMDSSTEDECQKLESVMGGPQRVADITGSRAYHRFTGNQIMKILHSFPSFFSKTSSICLVSSFMGSLFLLRPIGMDASDAAGTNLSDFRSRVKWSQDALRAVVQGTSVSVQTLERMLGSIVRSDDILGTIHPYFQQRWGFSPRCMITAFSGDNPCSLVGLSLSHVNDVGISMGTSDTVFALTSVSESKPRGDQGHIFPSPVDQEKADMIMICMKNGSLTREHVRNKYIGEHWSLFNEAMDASTPSPHGCLYFEYIVPEITPKTTQNVSAFFHENQYVITDPPVCVEKGVKANAHIMRALIETQLLAHRHHGAVMGLTHTPSRLVVTGGAANNTKILQIIADIWGCHVWTIRLEGGGDANTGSVNTAALGAAYMAKRSLNLHLKDKHSSSSSVVVSSSKGQRVVLVEAAAPRAEYRPVYEAMLKRYAECERIVLQQLANK